MRAPLSLLLLLPGCLAFGQGDPSGAPSGFNAVRPDVVIYVRGHPTGADIVQISMVDPKYPPAQLQKQVEDLCKRLNYPAQGLQIYTYTMGNGPNLKFLQASFATTGLTDQDNNANLTPLLQAFAGVQAPFTIKGMEVFYDEFDPPIKGPKNFKSSAVVVTGRRDSNPSQVEYSVQLLSQNPDDLLVSTKPPPVESKVNQVPVQNSTSALLWCLILVAGMAAGALVYFLLTRRLSGRSTTSVLRKH